MSASSIEDTITRLSSLRLDGKGDAIRIIDRVKKAAWNTIIELRAKGMDQVTTQNILSDKANIFRLLIDLDEPTKELFYSFTRFYNLKFINEKTSGLEIPKGELDEIIQIVLSDL